MRSFHFTAALFFGRLDVLGKRDDSHSGGGMRRGASSEKMEQCDDDFGVGGVRKRRKQRALDRGA